MLDERASVVRKAAASGTIEISSSAVPPSAGVTGNGTLCVLTFSAKHVGQSEIILSGSRLLEVNGEVSRLNVTNSRVEIQP